MSRTRASQSSKTESESNAVVSSTKSDTKANVVEVVKVTKTSSVITTTVSLINFLFKCDLLIKHTLL